MTWWKVIKLKSIIMCLNIYKRVPLYSYKVREILGKMLLKVFTLHYYMENNLSQSISQVLCPKENEPL